MYTSTPTHTYTHAHLFQGTALNSRKGAGDAAQWLGLYTALTEESQVWFPVPTLGSSLPPVTPAEGNLLLSSWPDMFTHI